MKDAVVNVILDTAAVAEGSALSEDETEFARRIFMAIHRRGVRRLAIEVGLSDERFAAINQDFEEWAAFCLADEAKWLLN
jgi:hypothetical protein